MEFRPRALTVFSLQISGHLHPISPIYWPRVLLSLQILAAIGAGSSSLSLIKDWLQIQTLHSLLCFGWVNEPPAPSWCKKQRCKIYSSAVPVPLHPAPEKKKPKQNSSPSRWPDVNPRKWHFLWKYPVVYNTQPRPGLLPINKSRSIPPSPLPVLDSSPPRWLYKGEQTWMAADGR